jgi:glycosyltransferase involved in cell wall biosynthesis
MMDEDPPQDVVRATSVLHVVWSLSIGGAERAVYQLALGQRHAGTDVGLLAASDPGFYGERLRTDGIHVESLGQRRGYDLPAAARGRRLFSDWDIVHFHGAEPPLMFAAALTSAAAFYTHRAGAFAYAARQRIRYRLAGTVIRRRFRGVVGNTEHAAAVAASLFHLPRASVGTVYNGIAWDLLRAERSPDDVRSELDLPGASFVLGTTGNLRDWKRVDVALRALARTRSEIVLVIVGDGPVEGPRLERLTVALGLRGRVRFVGQRANVADYLQVFDAFVLPSGPEESFGNSAVEAMGVGLPTIVMADGGGLVEHIEHGRTGVIAADVDDLASWIERFADDRGLCAAIGELAMQRARAKYTIDRVVGGYADLYSGRPIDQGWGVE